MNNLNIIKNNDKVKDYINNILNSFSNDINTVHITKDNVSSIIESKVYIRYISERFNNSFYQKL